MKTQIFVTLLTLLFSATTFACGTTMHLDTNENHWYLIKIDNRTYPAFYGNIDIHDITAGTHKVRIEKYKKYQPNRYSPSFTVFKGSIDFPHCGDVTGKLDERRGSLHLVRNDRRPLHPDDRHNSNQAHQDRYEDNRPENYPTHPQGSNGPIPNSGSQDPIDHKIHRKQNSYHQDHQDVRVISERSFYELIDDVRNTDYDHNKKHLIKYAIDNHNFTSRQIKKLLQLLDYDHSKLDIAKYAYSSVVDPTNYNIVFSEFDYDHSVRSLVDYIKYG